MTKETFKAKLQKLITDTVHEDSSPFNGETKVFDFKETEDRYDGFILGSIVYSNGYLAISSSRWNAASFALDTNDIEIFDFVKDWDKAFEFFWNKILLVPEWYNPNYEEQLMLKKESNSSHMYNIVKGSRYGMEDDYDPDED